MKGMYSFPVLFFGFTFILGNGLYVELTNCVQKMFLIAVVHMTLLVSSQSFIFYKQRLVETRPKILN